MMQHIGLQAAHDREERDRKLSAIVNLHNVQFGWRCRDGALSVEWDALRDGRLGSQPNLRFRSESNEIRVSLGQTSSQPPSSSSPFPEDNFARLLTSLDSLTRPTSEELSVVFRFFRLKALTYDTTRSGRPAIIFTFYYPPSFELTSTNALDTFSDREPLRMPLSSFGRPHAQIAPYMSLVMRVECNRETDLSCFQRMARFVHLRTSSEISPSVKRSLFSTNRLDSVLRWISRLDWLIAFQALKILNDGILHPGELGDLHPRIMALREQYGVEGAAEILRSFGTMLKTLGSGEEDEETTVAGCLNKAISDASPLHLALRNDQTDPSIFNCHHVTVTPTRILLDGPYLDQASTSSESMPIALINQVLA